MKWDDISGVSDKFPKLRKKLMLGPALTSPTLAVSSLLK